MYHFEIAARLVVALRRKSTSATGTLYERKHREKTTIQLDYIFPWCDGDCKVLTMTETKTGYMCASMVLAKGSGDRYAVHVRRLELEERHNKKIMESAKGLPCDQRPPRDLRTEDHSKNEIHYLDPWTSSRTAGGSKTRSRACAVPCGVRKSDERQKKRKHPDRSHLDQRRSQESATTQQESGTLLRQLEAAQYDDDVFTRRPERDWP